MPTGENLMGLSRDFGSQILDYIESHNIRFFKSYYIRDRVGLKRQQFSLGCIWLRDKGVIEKTGCPQSAWRVIG